MIKRGNDLSAYNVLITSDEGTRTITTYQGNPKSILFALDDEAGGRVLARWDKWQYTGDEGNRVDTFTGYVNTSEVVPAGEVNSSGLAGSLLKLPVQPPAWLPSLLKKLGINPFYTALIMWGLIAIIIVYLLFKFKVINIKRR